MSYVFITLGIIAALLALPFIGLPILVYFTYQMKVTPTLYPFVPSANSMFKETFEHFANSYVALQKCGFDLLICLKMPGPVENVDCSLALLVNRQSRDMAMITAIDASGQSHTLLYVEFVRRFRNGLVLQTNNSQQLSGLPDMPGHTTYRLPQVRDPAQLYLLHCKCVARTVPGAEPVLRLDEEFRGDAIQYLLAVYPEALFDAEQRGIFYRPAGGDHFRCTLYGAFRLSWQEVWPISAIRRRRRDRAARELLEELSRTPLP
jgi:hypothetical protein